MRPTKKPLSLNREIIRQLTPPDLASIRVGLENMTARCPTITCPTFGCPTWGHSCFDSCRDSDCCLEVP